MAQTNKMICPKCGAQMNHHAMKVDYGASLENPAAVDPVFGGVLQEAHACPQCGRIELRESREP